MDETDRIDLPRKFEHLCGWIIRCCTDEKPGVSPREWLHAILYHPYIQEYVKRNGIEMPKGTFDDQPNSVRWNIHLDGDDLMICDSEHHKDEICMFVRYVHENNHYRALKQAREEGFEEGKYD